MRDNLLKKIISRKSAVLFGLLMMVCGLFAISFTSDADSGKVPIVVKKDSLTSVRAFMEVYAVLKHPRCMNCHPIGDVPLQGEDSHLHTMLPQRGVDGKGVYAMKCNNCHQPTNTPGLHTPPGNPNWHLPPADMKMVFEGKSPRALAKQLLDPATNGHKTKQQLIEHVTSDSLVLGGWNPGEGRKLPPMSHKIFAAKFRMWIESGAYLPSSSAKAISKKK